MLCVAALIPARDEADVVAETVAAVRAVPGVDVVIVVDDGSVDGTAEAARRAGARVVAHASGRGKGAALRTAIEALAAESGGADFDAVLLLDADLGRSAEQAAALLAPIAGAASDMTIAAFPKPPAGAGGFGLVKALARWGIRRLSSPGFYPEAPLSGQRALSAAALRAVSPLADGYGVEVAMTVRALRAGLRVAEVPTTMTHRHTGRDVAGFAHRGRQFVDVAATLIALAMEPRTR